jgi:hypothetical protein
MKDFLLIFKTDYSALQQRTEAEAQTTMKKWMDWLGGIAAQNKLIDRGNRLADSGRVVKPNDTVINGPYTEIKESIGGYSLIKAENYDEAVAMAKGCPVLIMGGNVEVREIISM